MMTNEQLANRIATNLSSDSCVQQCCEKLSSGLATFMADHPGRSGASEALATLSIRKKTAAAANIEIQGIDAILELLRNRASSDVILLYHVKTADQVFTLFVEERSETVLGCIAVQRKTSNDGREF